MRTKTLLLTAALGAAGVASSMAQTVYSLNAVGYVNLALPAGFSMIANPLNASTNDLNTVIPNAPFGTTIFTFDNATSQYVSALSFGPATWSPDLVLNPGDGAFIQLAAATTLTFVGEVPQGNLSVAIPAGLSIKSMPYPAAVSLSSASLAFPASFGDTVYTFSNATGQYAASIFFGAGTGFSPDVTPAVGQSFFVSAASASTWNVTFSVNN